MKFRHHSASWRVSRRIGRGIARSIPDDQLGSCVVIAFILAVLAGSPILLLVFLGLIWQMMLPLVVLAAGVAVGIVAYFAIKNSYPQIFVSWFFLKEDEPDGTILQVGELKKRAQEFFAF